MKTLTLINILLENNLSACLGIPSESLVDEPVIPMELVTATEVQPVVVTPRPVAVTQADVNYPSLRKPSACKIREDLNELSKEALRTEISANKAKEAAYKLQNEVLLLKKQFYLKQISTMSED